MADEVSNYKGYRLVDEGQGLMVVCYSRDAEKGAKPDKFLFAELETDGGFEHPDPVLRASYIELFDRFTTRYTSPPPGAAPA